jgi:hypothetical protein
VQNPRSRSHLHYRTLTAEPASIARPESDCLGFGSKSNFDLFIEIVMIGGRRHGKGNRNPGTVSGLSENVLFSNFDYVAFTQGAGPVADTESGATASGDYGATAAGLIALAVRDAAISCIGAFGSHPALGWSARRGG